MLRRTAIAAAFVALAVPTPAGAVPVPMPSCPPQVVMPCVPEREGERSPLGAAARSGAEVVVKFWNTASFVVF